jgi:hypothetical protein
VKRKRRTTALFLAGLTLPSVSYASDPGSPSEWLFGLYLIIASPMTVANFLALALGSTLGWYKEKDAAVAHAAAATIMYATGALISLFAIHSAMGIFGALFIFAVLIWVSVKVPLKAHEIQKPYVREKLFKEYLE